MNEVQRQVDVMKKIQTDTEEERAQMQKLIEKGYELVCELKPLHKCMAFDNTYRVFFLLMMEVPKPL